MKKILLILALLLIPCFIFADVMVPAIQPFVGVVSNEDGAYLYKLNSSYDFIKTEEKLEYGTEVKVYDEMGYFYVVIGYDGYLLQKDVKPKNGEIVRNWEDEPKPTKNIPTILYLCIFGGIFASLAAIVIIVLVNRKKGKVNNV